MKYIYLTNDADKKIKETIYGMDFEVILELDRDGAFIDYEMNCTNLTVPENDDFNPRAFYVKSKNEYVTLEDYVLESAIAEYNEARGLGDEFDEDKADEMRG